MCRFSTLCLLQDDPAKPTVSPSRQRKARPGSPKPKLSEEYLLSSWGCYMLLCQLIPWQDTKHLKLAMLKEGLQDEPQFAVPPPKKLARVSSWTMKPPAQTARSRPSCIGVILQGSFYVYQANQAYIDRANDAMGMRHKATTALIFRVLCCRYVLTRIAHGAGQQAERCHNQLGKEYQAGAGPSESREVAKYSTQHGDSWVPGTQQPVLLLAGYSPRRALWIESDRSFWGFINICHGSILPWPL